MLEQCWPTQRRLPDEKEDHHIHHLSWLDMTSVCPPQARMLEVGSSLEKEGVVGTREAIKLLGKLPLKGINIVFMGPQLIPKKQIVIERKILTSPWVLAQYLTR